MPDLRKPNSLRNRTPATIAFQARLLNAVEHAIIAVDLDGTVRYWNHVAERMYGWPATEMVGQRKLSVLRPDDPQDPTAEIMARLHTGLSWSGEFLLHRRDGTTVPVLVTDSPVTNRSGRLIGVVAVSVDITERKRDEEALRSSEERFRGIVETAHDGIWTIDAEGLTTFVNRPLTELLGYGVRA